MNAPKPTLKVYIQDIVNGHEKTFNEVQGWFAKSHPNVYRQQIVAAVELEGFSIALAPCDQDDPEDHQWGAYLNHENGIAGEWYIMEPMDKSEVSKLRSAMNIDDEEVQFEVKLTFTWPFQGLSVLTSGESVACKMMLDTSVAAE